MTLSAVLAVVFAGAAVCWVGAYLGPETVILGVMIAAFAPATWELKRLSDSRYR